MDYPFLSYVLHSPCYLMPKLYQLDQCKRLLNNKLNSFCSNKESQTNTFAGRSGSRESCPGLLCLRKFFRSPSSMNGSTMSGQTWRIVVGSSDQQMPMSSMTFGCLKFFICKPSRMKLLTSDRFRRSGVKEG